MNNLTKENVLAFASLFNGYSKAYGSFTPVRADERGKVIGKNKTVRGQVTLEQIEHHLIGDGSTIGIIALRDDDTVLFGAIDYDNRNADLALLERACRNNNLPLVVCRSKSGGAHLYAFAQEPVPATIIQRKLEEWSAILGISAQKEIFPKQTSRFNDEDSGSYINLPYFKYEDTVRYAVIDGKPASLQAFITYAQSKKVALAELDKPYDGYISKLFPEGPPCLQHFERAEGFAEGGRNNGLLAVGVYVKKAFPDNWREKIDEYNQHMAKLGSEEVANVKKSVAKKDYNYPCRQFPINSVCQRKTCLTRSYGVGTVDEFGGRTYEINALTRYDHGEGEDPIWTMEIAGKRIQVTTQQFYSLDEFNKACVSQISILPMPKMTPIKWRQFISTLIPMADVISMPTEATPAGQLWEWVIKFATQRVYAIKKEEVLVSGKPYREGEQGWFRIFDLFTFLDRHKINYGTPQKLAQLLHKKGAERTFWNMKSGACNVWGLVMPLIEDEDDVRKIAGSITPNQEF
jgi:hypothetical protein